MMRVKFRSFGFDREMTLEQALMTDQANTREGSLEVAKASADHANEQMARLLAHLVEEGKLELEAAFSIAGVYVEDLELINNG